MRDPRYIIIQAINDFYGGSASDEELTDFLAVPQNKMMLAEVLAKVNTQFEQFQENKRNKDNVKHPFEQQDIVVKLNKNLPADDAVIEPDSTTKPIKDTPPKYSKSKCGVFRPQSTDVVAKHTFEQLQESNPKQNKTVGDNEKKLVQVKNSPSSTKPAVSSYLPDPISIKAVYSKSEDVVFRLQNARVGAKYDNAVEQDSSVNIKITNILDLAELGLQWDQEQYKIIGTPTKDGSYPLRIVYSYDGKVDKYIATIELVVISDPKNLWKDLPSDQSVAFWKTDDAYSGIASNNYVLAGASRRGRSHAHIGSCRDDDFNLLPSTNNGWQILAVADGAGSAKFSREGARIAVHTSSDLLVKELDNHDDELLAAMNKYHQSEGVEQNLQNIVYSVFCNPIYKVVEAIHELAGQHKASFKDFYTTLLIAAHKEINGRHYVIGYWRGDGAMALFSENNCLNLLGSPDGGEYAGQTRFMDTSAALQEDILTRVKFAVVDDISAIFLLTDGITDPMFKSENDLRALTAWDNYWHQQVKPQLSNDPKESAKKLWKSLDFWSPGNHDDRTIAVLYKKNVSDS